MIYSPVFHSCQNTNKSHPKRENINSKMGISSSNATWKNNNIQFQKQKITIPNQNRARLKFHSIEILHNLYNGILLDYSTAFECAFFRVLMVWATLLHDEMEKMCRLWWHRLCLSFIVKSQPNCTLIEVADCHMKLNRKQAEEISFCASLCHLFAATKKWI